jgi:pullulanase/glycogen debranching enzyme
MASGMGCCIFEHRAQRASRFHRSTAIACTVRTGRRTEGQRFNPAKLLLDPYAREILGTL